MTSALAPVITVRSAPVSEPPPQSEPRPRHLHLVPDPPQLPLEMPARRQAIRTDRDHGQHPRPGTLPPIAPFARSYARAVSEVLTGHRSADLLAKNTTLGTLNWIRSLAPAVPARLDRTSPSPVVLQVHVCEVRDSVCEATALVRRGPRVRAMSLRFVGMDRRWHCSHLEVI